jgi:hypothetical protein
MLALLACYNEDVENTPLRKISHFGISHACQSSHFTEQHKKREEKKKKEKKKKMMTATSRFS